MLPTDVRLAILNIRSMDPQSFEFVRSMQPPGEPINTIVIDLKLRHDRGRAAFIKYVTSTAKKIVSVKGRAELPGTDESKVASLSTPATDGRTVSEIGVVVLSGPVLGHASRPDEGLFENVQRDYRVVRRNKLDEKVVVVVRSRRTNDDNPGTVVT